MEDRSNKSSDKARRKRVIIYTAIGVGVVAVGGAAYLLLTREKPVAGTLPEPDRAEPLPTHLPPTPPNGNGTANQLPQPPDGFPLKRGARGPLVVALQKLLNARFKAGLATDGDFGRKTEAALSKAGLPTVIDAATYEALVAQQAQPGNPTASEVVANWTGTPLELATKAARGIAYWVNARNADSVMTFVHAMRNVSDYKAVSDILKTIDTANAGGTLARRTLVNVLVGDDMPWTEFQKGQFANELLRMGLKYNQTTDKWALSGLGPGHPTVRVSTPTVIWNSSGLQGHAPAGTRLGMAVASGGGITQVHTPSGETVYVPTHALSQVIL